MSMTTILRDRSAKRLRAAEIAFGLVFAKGSDRARHDATWTRICTRCGERAPFRIDPVGGWAECTICGRLN
jgi:hypothetical protein